MSIYIVFRGPDRSVIVPLLYQKYLWPFAWLGLSLLWLSLLYNQKKVAQWRERMQKESHLASIGKMSARLAHEIKNPLGAVRGLAQLLGKKLVPQPELQDLSQQIEKETFRLEELTRNILDFSKPKDLSPVRLNVDSVLADTVNLFKNQHDNCNVACSFSDQSAYALCDENALRQILLNLLKNAFDAGKSECCVEIATKMVGSDCVVHIKNNGHLENEVIQNLFEPFFSTRVHGYGLGLPICKKLVEQMHGNLSLKNLPENRVLAELTLTGGSDD
jgi:two-component system sensor histidine kinase HydH